MVSVTITHLDHFDEAFGDLGLTVGPRTGTNKRSQDDKEWFVIRRFLKSVLKLEKFALPLAVDKLVPPSPDFSFKYKDAIALVEITEATSQRDQKEMTLSESRNGATLLGEDAGRFSEGIVGDHLERVWTADILRAIRRKRSKSVFLLSEPERHLIIYPNFPAQMLLDEEEASIQLQKATTRRRPNLARTVKGCKVHVLRQGSVMFDVLSTS